MLIIDGYMGKSRKLVEILKEKGTSEKDTLILDSVGISELVRYGETYKVIAQNAIEHFLEKVLFNSRFKYVVLEFNASRDSIYSFKQLELRFKKEFILTVQCPEKESQEEIKVYMI